MLDFRIAPYDGMLEATVPEGYYNIYDMGKFAVNAYLNGQPVSLGEFGSLLEAIAKAEEHYERHGKK